jgi:mannosylglycoprotein endo-beta-mannosidase
MPKAQEGLGIPCLRDVNICLLASWLNRYSSGEGKLWKSVIDAKYNTKDPNIFSCNSFATSRFFKGFMWAVNSVKFGFRWIVGDGSKIKFWEDTWFGTSPLSVQFWEIYCICNEPLATISEVWDGNSLKLTFRRNFNDSLMEQWFELEQIANNISFSEDCDSLIWTYDSSGQFSTSSCYNIISFGGVTPVYIPAIWSLVIPPRVHIFLWLLCNNKLMTRDNLQKRNLGKPVCCMFCSENESIELLFFRCIIAKKCLGAGFPVL